MFQILCRVSGGVTGTREAILKANGQERWFETRDEAQLEATRLTQQMNHKHSTADFRYTVIDGGSW